MYEYYQIRNSTNLVDLKLSSVNPLIDNDNFSYIDLSTLPLDFDYSKRYMLVDGSLQVYEEPQIVVSDTILIRDVRNKRDRLLDESSSLWTPKLVRIVLKRKKISSRATKGFPVWTCNLLYFPRIRKGLHLLQATSEAWLLVLY